MIAKILNSHSISLMCALALLGISLSGCVGETEEINPPAYPFIAMAPSAPPPTPFEYGPKSPDPPHLAWRPGYWSFDGQQFNWVAGEMIDRPSPTAVWSADRWEKHMYGWVFIPGYWQ